MRTWQGLVGLTSASLAVVGIGAMVYMLYPPGPQWRRVLRLAVSAPVGAAAVTGLVFAGLALWGHPQAGHPPADRWLNVVLGLAALTTIAGAVVGLTLAVRYGRKASVHLTADAVESGLAGVIVRVRPMVRAVGIFRIRFRINRGAVVTTTEVWADDSGALHDGRFWDQDAIFGPSFVEGGETLTTMVVFPLGQPPDRVVGWRVSIAIAVPKRRLIPRDSWTWADRVFVARSQMGTVGGS